MFDKLKEGSTSKEMADMIKESAAEAFMPEIEKMAKAFGKPALQQFSDYLGDDDRFVIIRKDKKSGKFYVMIVETKSVEEMKISKDGYRIIPLDTPESLITMMLSGELIKKL